MKINSKMLDALIREIDHEAHNLTVTIDEYSQNEILDESEIEAIAKILGEQLKNKLIELY